MSVPAHVIVATAVALVLAAGGQIAQRPAERRPQYEQAGRELREWPVFDALAEVDPEAYAEIGRLLKQAAAKPSAKASLQVKAWQYFDRRFGSYVLAATDGAIIRYYQNVVRMLDDLKIKDATICQVLEGRPVEGTTTVQRRDALMAAMENLINSARGRGVVFLEIMPAAAGVYLDNIINRVIETPRDKAIIDAEKVAPADRERRCQLEARILREMTRQPVNVSADLLRLLASNNLSIRR